ncbi:conserved hypothetical protein [Perkinsus marinus ATCC 50983]|uniref:Reverse transcriptase zinc-binding domain-containing protein n=1 Tax=Perkinsus marinus (strain ATCC 50983 / TXsc) TaxID=423536 RepID=C5LXS7_PERM5|nr:conserved hypothetical protein [Perkinsus marinus ATCC 50983]EEQ98465.1 conserved hypothetical protein [Perkinsus marinus ATCC 50983]|eukprot:XP_002765748.1 conserved hypothetical protein [Perkinsus marinus ATCC 50983]
MNVRANCIPTRSFPKRQRDPNCRVCGRTDESITHLLTSCVALQHAEYLHRHNAVAKVIYSNALELLGFKMQEEYWTWTRPPSMTHGEKRVLWDQNIPTPRRVEHSRPDLLIRNGKRIVVCEIGVTSDSNVVQKEREKKLRYQPLLRELQQLHPDCTIQLLVVVIGVTGAITKQLVRGVREAGLDCSIVSKMQRAAATHSAHLLLRILYSRKLLAVE